MILVLVETSKNVHTRILMQILQSDLFVDRQSFFRKKKKMPIPRFSNTSLFLLKQLYYSLSISIKL